MDTKEKRKEESAGEKLLVFVLESKTFGIELTKIKEITDLLPMARLPGADKSVKGLGNLRGEIIPIISLRERLKIGGDEKGEHIIIVRGGRINYGLMIDKIDGIFETEKRVSKSISSVFSKDIDTSFLKGVSRIDDKDVVLLDCKKLIEINP